MSFGICFNIVLSRYFLFSATWPEGVRRIANEYMDNPIQVCVGTLDLAAVHSVTQHVEIIAEEDKRQRVIMQRKTIKERLMKQMSISSVVGLHPQSRTRG